MKRAAVYGLPLFALVLIRLTTPPNICDDAYITLKVALNTATGHFFQFNADRHEFVTTSPLWTLAIAGLRALTGDVVVSVVRLGFACEVLLVIAIVEMTRRLRFGSWVGAIAAVLLVTNPVFILTSMSGMELPLYLLAFVVTARLIAREQNGWALATAAVAVWVRFDGLLLYAFTLAVVLWRGRGASAGWNATLRTLAPSLGILATYAAFGLLVFGSPVPTSVLRKVGTSTAPFSSEWLRGVEILVTELVKAPLGKSTYWYTASSPLLGVALPFVIGAVLVFRRREPEVLWLCGLCGVYAVALAASGSPFARNFPWYFAPVLPAVYLVAANGVAWMIHSVVGLDEERGSHPRRGSLVVATLSLGWTFALWHGAVDAGARSLTSSELTGAAERERVYAASALWAGTHLVPGATVAANEIGAVGFFLPRSMSILDMGGLLDPDLPRRAGYVAEVAHRRPELVFTRVSYRNAKEIDDALPGRYTWYAFRTLNVGIRSDLAARLGPKLQELSRLRESVDLGREPPAPSTRSTGHAVQ